MKHAMKKFVYLVLSLAMPPTALALDGSAVVTGGVVEFYGAAETNWLNGTELLLKFTGEGSFVLPGISKAKARVLAVGGGGGGAGVFSARKGMVSPFGGAGGGGGGGLVEVTNVFSAATYAVAVGAGGAGGASASTHAAGLYHGTTGEDTTLTTNGVAIITAKGGGGGGGEGVGLDGGSGGGGSQFGQSSTVGQPRVGGSGIDGQGHAGGTGDVGLYGGGGGGAGSAGAPASTLNPIGGEGRACDITGASVWYAGGGGGGFSDKSFTGSHAPIAGGRGGGGNGGYGLNVARTDATFYGGGGGGCGAIAPNATTPGGSGYAGVVYVRISIVASEAIVKPTDQTVDFDGAEHALVPANPAYVITDLTEGSPTYGQVVSRMAGTNAGTYKAKVALIEGFEWPSGGSDDVTVTLTINKATPVISNLRIRSWSAGTPAASTPNPGCDVSIAASPTYEYGDSATGPWSAEKPAAAGTHYLRAYVEETANYNAAESVATFEIWNAPGDRYRDYVEITIASSLTTVSDFIFTLKLAENAPVGFLYARAGETGENLTITDAAGTILDYKVETWNTAGESTLFVKLPELSTSPQVIRLFWCLREGKDAPGHSSAIDDPSSDPQPQSTFDLVVRDGKRINYWITYPSLTKTEWLPEENDPGTVSSYGTVKEGDSSLLYSMDLKTGDVVSGIPTSGGLYSVVFGLYDPVGDYEPLEYGIDIFILGYVYHGELAGDYSGKEDGITRNGRVLLANDDTAFCGFAVKGQSYWQTDSAAYNTYWEHSMDHGVNLSVFPYLRPYANHTLYTKDSASNPVTLWTLENVIIGSTYAAGPTMRSNGCYLPNSPTAKAISSEAGEAGPGEQGTMVMRNMDSGVAILSPLYANGVGTIYFDAVNSTTEYATNGCYKIQVEVSTDGGANYAPYKMKPFRRDGTAAFVADQTDTEELTLAITTGGTTNNFYRVAVPVNANDNVRFKIVRTACVPGSTWAEDENGFIIVDNILVSYPLFEPFADGDIVLAGCTNVYDGAAHTIAVTNRPIHGLTLQYAIGARGESTPPDGAQWSDAKPGFTDVTNVTVFVEASAPGYFAATNSAAVVITPRPLTVTARSEAFTYDGHSHGNALCDVEGLVASDAIAASAAGSISFPRESPVTNVVAGYEFTSGSDANYSVTTQNGTLTMTPRPVTFAGKSETRNFRGSEIKITTVETNGLGLVAGHTHNVAFSARGTDVGTYTGTITDRDDVVIKSGGTDVTPHYDVTVVNGSLTIEQDPNLTFEVLLDDETFPYDGEAHSLTNAATSTALSGATAIEYAKEGGTWTNELSSLTATNVADSCAILVRATNPNYANLATNSATLAITPRDIAEATVDPIGTLFYEGTPLTPAVSVKLVGLRPAAGTDYDAAYTNNAAAGTATITLAGKGNYAGTKRVEFTILPQVTATLRWKYARNANGWFCGQIAIPWYEGYNDALSDLRFLFADRTNETGVLTAYLVDPAKVIDPLGTTETHDGVEYRVAALDTTPFAAFDGGDRAVFGVKDGTLASSLESVPKEERTIPLRVVNRDITTVEPLDNKIAWLAWKTDGQDYFLPLVGNWSSAQTAASGTASAAGAVAAPSSLVALRSSLAPQPLTAAALNQAVSFGLPLAAMARAQVVCRIASVSFGDDGVTGTFAVAAEDADGIVAESGALGPDVSLTVLGAETLDGGFAELDAAECGVELTGREPPYGFRVARPGQAQFFKVKLEAEDAYE